MRLGRRRAAQLRRAPRDSADPDGEADAAVHHEAEADLAQGLGSGSSGDGASTTARRSRTMGALRGKCRATRRTKGASDVAETVTGQAIETMLAGGASLPAAAGVRGAGERAARDLRPRLRGVLGARGPRARHLVRALHEALRVGAAVRQVVPRRQAERRLQLRRPPRRGRERRQGRLPLGGRARGRAADDHFRRPPGRGRQARERAQEARRREGHARRDLHGDGPRGAGRDARLRAARRAAHGRLRRLLGRRARRPAERHGLRGADHPGRGPAQRRHGAAEAQRRRGALTRAGREARRRPAAHRRRGRLERRPRPLVARARGRGGRRPRVLPVRADGLRGPALPALHERHDREAEGDRAHDGRLPRRHRDDPPLHLRRQARLGLLVRGRHRLGDRPQLHRLRAALQRHDQRALRGRPELPGQGPLVGDRRALQGRHPLHGADRDPDAHEVGPRVRARSTTSPRCGCSARSASRSTPRPGSGTASTSAATARRSSTPGGRPRRG